MDTRNVTYMFYGFAVVWAILFAYVIYIVTREKKLKGELDRVKSMLEEERQKK